MTDRTAERRIVVGVDGSQPSRHALQWARFMARVLNAAIDAVAVWDLSAVMAEGWVDDWNPEKETAANLHSTLEEVLGAQPTVPVREVVRRGSAARELVQASQGAQLLIAGSRGHGGFTGLLLGSVSSACAEHAHCPVLIIHGDTPPPPPAISRGHVSVDLHGKKLRGDPVKTGPEPVKSGKTAEQLGPGQ